MNSPLSKDQIIDQHVLTFDPSDKANGSLYVGEPLDGSSGLHLQTELAALRAAGLWSAEPEKQVPEAHRAAYKEQLQLVGSVAYQSDGGSFIIARFDHPKFPSDAARWAAWQQHFDSRFTRR